MLKSPVIYTDLDGTLLDHDTYSADEARRFSVTWRLERYL